MSATSEGVAAPAVVEWRYNPWRERPAQATSAAALGLGTCAVVVSLGESLGFTVALCVAALGTLAPALMPARCRIDDEGVAREGWLGRESRPWSSLRHATLGVQSLLVSPYTERHWLEAWRALRLPLPARGDARLRAAITDRLARHGLAHAG